MSKVFKVSLPNPDGGFYNALTDTNPDHFSLYVDGDTDHILIKEKVRDVIEVSSVLYQIPHELGYVPLCYVYAEVSTGVWRQLFSRALDGTSLWYTINDTHLVLNNDTGTPRKFAYYIFYDDIN